MLREKRPCSEGGCGRPEHARGLCSAHYQRAWKRGVFSKGPRKSHVKAPPVKVCPLCGSEFRSSRATFCSRACANRAYYRSEEGRAAYRRAKANHRARLRAIASRGG